MKRVYFLLFALSDLSICFAQCPNVNITLAVQSQVDNFQTTYPGCTTPSKSIIIDGSIDNLSGLQNITSIGGDLEINSTLLSNLNGLDNLTNVTGRLSLDNNSTLSIVTGLGKLQTLGTFRSFLTPLTSLTGLSSLKTVGGIDLSYTLLTNLNGLEKVTSLNFLSLVFNGELTSLSGLHNAAISPYFDDYYIVFNSKLSDCTINFICKGTPDRPGTIGSEIGENANGCNGEAQVYALCKEAGLPVQLVSFNAKKNDQDQVRLQWVTSSEINSKYFQIERSSEGRNWQILHKVMGQGESNSTHMYSYTDEVLSSQTNYYRLKMVDQDETFAYSKIVTVSISGHLGLGIYPNPVNDNFQLGANDLLDFQKMEIYNQHGKIVYESLSAHKLINVKHFTTGQYVVIVKKVNGSIARYKLVKQ